MYNWDLKVPRMGSKKGFSFLMKRGFQTVEFLVAWLNFSSLEFGGDFMHFEDYLGCESCETGWVRNKSSCLSPILRFGHGYMVEACH